MADSFRGSTALVTGASFGIGARLAEAFAAEGARLVLSARTTGALEEVAGRCRAAGAEVTVIPGDLADPAGPRTLVEALAARGLVVDHLVNNAGFSTHGRLVEAGRDAQLAVVQVNARAALELALHLAPGMVERGRGGILNLCSTAAFQGAPWMAVYSATKAFMLSWSEAMHVELRGTGVHCTCVCPGPVRTGFFRRNGFPGEPPGFLLEDPGTVARRALRAYRRNRSHSVTALGPRLGAWATRLVPRAVAAFVAAGYAHPRGLGRRR